MLTFAQPREEHDLAVVKLKRIAMEAGLVRVNLPEPRDLPKRLELLSKGAL